VLDELNSRVMEHLGKSRRELYETLERPCLRALPEKPYEFAQHKVTRVNIDYHVEFDKHFYSVPHLLVHQEVRVRATEHLVEIYHKSKTEPVAVFPRGHREGGYSTCKEHMPPRHKFYAEWTPERFMDWAARIGPQTASLVQAVLASRQHPEQAFRACLGILNLEKKSDAPSLELACQQAISSKRISYREVKDILDHLPPQIPDPSVPPTHPNLRGEAYYQ